MTSIYVGRYGDGEAGDYTGWVEPQDRSWILFLRDDGASDFFPHRDPKTGAVEDSTA